MIFCPGYVGRLLSSHFPNPTPIAGMIGDSHTAAFGEGCFHSGEAKGAPGAGFSIPCNIGPAPSQHGMVAIICWSTKARTDYALEGVIVIREAAVKWQGSTRPDCQKRRRRVHGPIRGGQRRRPQPPRFQRDGRPHWKMDARDAIVGLTFGSGKAHIVWTAYESEAFQIKDVIEAMQQDSGALLAEFKAGRENDGEPVTDQLMADLLWVTAADSGLEEGTALGGGVFEGLADLEALPRDQVIFDLSGSAGRIQENYEIWRG